MKPAEKEFYLRLADSALILSHRLGEYSSNGPYLEEDLALSNIALDLLGQAEDIYGLVCGIEGDAKTPDDLVYKRNELDYRAMFLTQVPNTDFAFVMLRQCMFSQMHLILLEDLLVNAKGDFAGILAKSIKEVNYHLRKSKEWMIRLAGGTTESKDKLQWAIEVLWRYAADLFEYGVFKADIEKIFGIDVDAISSRWYAEMEAVLQGNGMLIDQNAAAIKGSHKGYHTEYMGYILTDMQYLVKSYPDAKW